MKRWIIAVAAGLLLAGCSSIESGYVMEREYDDPDTWSSMEPVYTTECRSTGGATPSTQCSQRLLYYRDVEHYDGPHWRLRLRNNEDEGWRTVTEREYYEYKIGDHYPRSTEAGGQG